MKKSGFIVVCFSVFVFLSCGQEKKAESKAQKVVAVNAESQIKDKNVSVAYSQYLKVKDAFVDKDVGKIKETSSKLSASLKQINGFENTVNAVEDIAKSDDLEVQRKKFSQVSEDIIELIQSSALKFGSIYIQRCPMANDGKGASWLAAESEIRNPYYGDEMLNCGEVQEELKHN